MAATYPGVKWAIGAASAAAVLAGWAYFGSGGLANDASSGSQSNSGSVAASSQSSSTASQTVAQPRTRVSRGS